MDIIGEAAGDINAPTAAFILKGILESRRANEDPLYIKNKQRELHDSLVAYTISLRKSSAEITGGTYLDLFSVFSVGLIRILTKVF